MLLSLHALGMPDATAIQSGVLHVSSASHPRFDRKFVTFYFDARPELPLVEQGAFKRLSIRLPVHSLSFLSKLAVWKHFVCCTGPLPSFRSSGSPARRQVDRRIRTSLSDYRA
jgi:hypothetical protein